MRKIHNDIWSVLDSYQDDLILTHVDEKYPVAHPGIDKDNTDILLEFIHTTAGTANLLYALQRSRGHAPLEILKHKASNGHSSAYCFWDWSIV